MNNKNVRYKKRYFRIIPMTTIIGIKCKNGIAIGSDSQLKKLELIRPLSTTGKITVYLPLFILYQK